MDNMQTHARVRSHTHTHTRTRSQMNKDAARNKRENKGTRERVTEWGFNNVCLSNSGSASSEHYVVSKNTEVGQAGI